MNDSAPLNPTLVAPPVQARASRTQWVYEIITQHIAEGLLPSGSRILEDHIARTLGISRTPVREAIVRLMTTGVLEKNNEGLVVAKLSETEVGEIYSLREILEGSAARFVAQHVSSVTIAKLQIICKKFEEARGDRARIHMLNQEFHNTIHEAAQNRYLHRTLNEMNALLALMPQPTFDTDGRFEASLVEHQRIVDAIASSDADKAEVEARQHVRSAHRTRIEKMFE